MAEPIALVHDLLRRQAHPLDPFFSPSTVAVIGATEAEGSVGRTLLRNLIGSPFGGTVFPVNPKRSGVLGIKAYPGIRDVPARVDLAVIVTPAAAVPAVVGECVDAGVRAAIVISAGFRELGAPGRALEAKLLEQAQRGSMRLVGPNCLGVMNPLSGLNATFAHGMARPGTVAFISQSGALLTAILDWSLREQVGFSAFVSVGSMLDVGWGDLIDYLGDDPRTRAIVIYMETVGDARAFVSAAREVALAKPIIVIKAGRSDAAARAAASHTGALAGSHDVLTAAFHRTGVLPVETIDEVFSLAEVLGKQPRPRGPRLTIVTNAGGPAVLATDTLVAGGGELATLAPDTIARLSAILPPAWSHNNPIDVLGDAGPERYAEALRIAADDAASDGLLVVLTPQDMTDPTQTAERLRTYASIDGTPVLASWMGAATVQAGVDILNRAGIPTFEFPDTAARTFCSMWRYTYNLRGLYETPELGEAGPADGAAVRRLVDRARAGETTLLDEYQSKQVLAAYGIPTVETRVASSAAEAVAAARAIGFPVAVKLYSHTLTHKTDVGGVRLNLPDETAVAQAFDGIRDSVARAAGAAHFQGVTVQAMIDTRDGYELIVGSSLDPQFGPVLLFGSGGQLVEVMRDRALALPPLNATLARRLIDETRIAAALRGVRGRAPVDLAALADVLVRFSDLVVEQPGIREIDINPLLASAGRLVALDARVVVHPAEAGAETMPPLAIRPYPSQYIRDWIAPDGQTVTIRPIRPEDEPLMVAFHRRLSERTVRLRFEDALALDARTAHERLIRVCFIDYDREIALVAQRRDQMSHAGEILAVARLRRQRTGGSAEFALVVADAWQGRGLGTELLARIVDVGREERMTRVVGRILPENAPMQRLCTRLGFTLRPEGDQVVMAERVL